MGERCSWIKKKIRTASRRKERVSLGYGSLNEAIN